MLPPMIYFSIVHICYLYAQQSYMIYNPSAPRPCAYSSDGFHGHPLNTPPPSRYAPDSEPVHLVRTTPMDSGQTPLVISSSWQYLHHRHVGMH